MPESKVVAVYASSPALTAILAAVLAAVPRLRVRRFESAGALTTYARLNPVDLLVCDFDCAESPAAILVRAMRRDPGRNGANLQVIALTRRVDGGLRRLAGESGIDEVMVKPMSPKYLLERALARLGPQGPGLARKEAGESLARLERRSRKAAAWGGNVVALFGEQPSPR